MVATQASAADSLGFGGALGEGLGDGLGGTADGVATAEEAAGCGAAFQLALLALQAVTLDVITSAMAHAIVRR